MCSSTVYKKGQKGKKEVSEQKRKDKEKKADSENDKSREEEEEEEEERMEEEPEAENEAEEEEEVENWWSSDGTNDEMHSHRLLLRLSLAGRDAFKWRSVITEPHVNQHIQVYSVTSSLEVSPVLFGGAASVFQPEKQKHKETMHQTTSRTSWSLSGSILYF